MLIFSRKAYLVRCAVLAVLAVGPSLGATGPAVAARHASIGPLTRTAAAPSRTPASTLASSDDSAGGPHTLTPAQAIAQQVPLTLTDGAYFDHFGYAVALSADGNTALVGAPNRQVGINQQGAAYVFVRNGGNWTQQATLSASDGVSGDLFGWSVALSGDGNVALIGAPEKHVGNYVAQGAAYLFVRSGSTWTQQTTFSASDEAAGDAFGWAVALNPDGLRALIGAPGKTVGTNAGQGAAYVFARNTLTGVWTQQATLTSSDTAGRDHNFGDAVALSGNTALVGIPNSSLVQVDAGVAYVFVFVPSGITGGTWAQQTILYASDVAEDDQFGWSVALSGDGNIALIGAPLKVIGGAAYLFARNGSSWTQQITLSASDAAITDGFGRAVALSEDGRTALVGVPTKQVGANAGQGAAYTFVHGDSGWSQLARLTANDGAASDWFGYAVALDAEGYTALAGAYLKTIDTHTEQGAAYIMPTASASITLSRASAHYKDPVTVTGSGFGHGETVNVYLDSTTSTPLTSTSSTAEGSLSAMFEAPQAISGTHSLIAEGISSDRSASAPFTALPGAYLLHYQGNKGTLDILKGAGFAPHETVVGYWNSTSGTPFTQTATTNSIGTFGGSASYPGITFTVPLSPTGQYLVYAVGQSSGGVAHATFTLNPSVSVKPTSAHAGASVTVSGTGYGADETVTLKYNCGTSSCSSTTVLATPTTNSNGFFSVAVTLPASTSLGVHALGGKGFTSGVFATSTVTITST